MINKESNERYATFLERLFAFAIDFTIIIIVILIYESIYPISQFSGTTRPINSRLLSFVIWVLYYSLLESSKMQGTIGKWLLSIKVVDDKRQRVSIKIATIRYLSIFFSVIPLGFGIWSILTDEKKQGWHDMIAGCYLIKVKMT